MKKAAKRLFLTGILTDVKQAQVNVFIFSPVWLSNQLKKWVGNPRKFGGMRTFYFGRCVRTFFPN
jgi:hypothetical protein